MQPPLDINSGNKTWPTAFELNAPDLNRGPFQEPYFERLVRAKAIQQSTSPKPIPSIETSINRPKMSAAVMQRSAPPSTWQSMPVELDPLPGPIPSESMRNTPAQSVQSDTSSNRFGELLRTKIAKERQEENKDKSTVTAEVFAPSQHYEQALEYLKSTNTVVNRSFAAPYYATPIMAEAKPAQTSIGNSNAQGNSYRAQEAIVQPSADDLAMCAAIAARIGSIYEHAQVPRNTAAVLNRDQYAWSNASSDPPHLTVNSNGSSYSDVKANPNFRPQSAMDQPEAWNEHSQISPTNSANPDWPPMSDSRGGQPQSTEMYHNGSNPFMWSVTPSSQTSGNDPLLLTPSLDSSKSHSVPPVTPLMSAPYPSYGANADVKPIISPVLGTSPLPREDHFCPPYDTSASSQMKDSLALPQGGRYISASDGQQHDSSSAGIYNFSSNGNGGGSGHGSGGMDGSNGLGDGLDFGQGGSGSGSGGDGNEGGGGGAGGGGRTTRGKKLSLACHFCRRRKLKCDGQKPSCDNCNKRGAECSYDDQVRRRGPGKRTKEMRDRAHREAQDAGLLNQNSASSTDLKLMLDQPGGSHNRHHRAVMEAMGAVMDAGIDLGMPPEVDPMIDPALVGEPATLAQIGSEHSHDEMGMGKGKRKSEGEQDPTKRMKMEAEGLGNGDEHDDLSHLPDH